MTVQTDQFDAMITPGTTWRIHPAPPTHSNRPAEPITGQCGRCQYEDLKKGVVLIGTDPDGKQRQVQVGPGCAAALLRWDVAKVKRVAASRRIVGTDEANLYREQATVIGRIYFRNASDAECHLCGKTADTESSHIAYRFPTGTFPIGESHVRFAHGKCVTRTHNIGREPGSVIWRDRWVHAHASKVQRQNLRSSASTYRALKYLADKSGAEIAAVL